MTKILLATLIGGCLAASASAATILIDFGTALTTGTTPVWNNFTSSDGGTVIPDGTNTNLVDTTGASTGYTITVSGGALNSLSDNSTVNTLGDPVTTYAPFTPATVVQDAVFQTGTRTFTLSGLNPSVSYALTFYTYVDRSSSRGSSYAISGHAPLLLEPSGSPIALDSGGQVGTITGVIPDASGNIAIVVTSTASTNWILSGLAINYTVPEPSSLLLCVTGAGLFCLRRRRDAGEC